MGSAVFKITARPNGTASAKSGVPRTGNTHTETAAVSRGSKIPRTMRHLQGGGRQQITAKAFASRATAVPLDCYPRTLR